MTIPTRLTLFRCAAVFAIAVLIALGTPWSAIGAFVLFVAAALSDWLDGHLARRLDQATDFGRMLDSIADKLLVGVTLLMLCAGGTLVGIHAIAAALILAREIAMSGVREHLIERGIVIPASLAGKWKTTVQLAALAVLLAAPVVGPSARTVGLTLLWLAVALTLFSAAQYMQGVRERWDTL